MVQLAVNEEDKSDSSQFMTHIKDGVYVKMVQVLFEKSNMEFIGGNKGTVIMGLLNCVPPR